MNELASNDGKKRSQKTLLVGVGVGLALLVVVVGFKKILSSARCSSLEKEVAAASASALGGSLTAETILAARDAAQAKAQAAGLGPVTVETAIERRTNVQLQTTAHLVIEVHAGDCHAAFERPVETSLSPEDLALLAEQGVQERKKAPAGHHH